MNSSLRASWLFQGFPMVISAWAVLPSLQYLLFEFIVATIPSFPPAYYSQVETISSDSTSIMMNFLKLPTVMMAAYC